jgi:hypothetical protein
MARPALTIKTGQVGGQPAVVIIPADKPTDIRFLGIKELTEQIEDLESVLTDSNYHSQAVVVERLLHLLKAKELFTRAAEVADELAASGEVESALLIDTVVAVLKQEMRIE